MYPVVLATEFHGIVPKGGSTKPWVVEAIDPSGRADFFVVKMFTPKQIQQQNAVSKEVFGNVLARAFDLPVPDFAFVRFDKPFLETLQSPYSETERASAQGLRFGSRFASGHAIWDDAVPSDHIDLQKMACIYAFDNLVRNLDRGGFRKKPNLLVRDGAFLLIDHEQIFPFADDPDDYNDAPILGFQKGEWAYPHEVHLFYPQLKSLSKAQKVEVFTTFAEHLSRLDPYLLEDWAQILAENHQPVGNLELITDYLKAVKQAPEAFIKLLQNQLA